MEKDLAAARKEAEQAERKLANDSFLAKAPAEVVAKTRDRLDAARADIDRLTGPPGSVAGAARTGALARREHPRRRPSRAGGR